MLGQIVTQRMQLRGHRAEHRGWPTRNRHMHFLAADIDKGCTRIQHCQITHPRLPCCPFRCEARQEPSRVPGLQTSPTGSAMLAKLCNRQRSEPTSGPGNQCTRGSCGHTVSRRSPAANDTMFMVRVQRRLRRWRLRMRSRFAARYQTPHGEEPAKRASRTMQAEHARQLVRHGRRSMSIRTKSPR
jgi:hypothetical protein